MRTLRPLVLGLTLLALVSPFLFGKSLWLRDMALFAYPTKMYLRDRLFAGELPLWNPLLGLGRPFLGMVQPGVLYPGNLILALPSPFGVDLFFVAHLFLAAYGMRAWLRALGSDETEASVGGIVLGLSGYLVSMLAGEGFYLVGVAWVPWMLATTARAPADERLRTRAAQAARLALLGALALTAGDPQALFLGLLACAFQAAAAPDRKSVARGLAVVAAGGALCALIAAAQILPGLEVGAVGRPGGALLEDAAHFALAPARLLELVWPGAFGEPYSRGWFVHALVDEGTGVRYQPWAAGIYLGLLTPMLAIAALLGARRQRIDVALLALGLCGLLLALGPHAPVWRAWFQLVPGARLFRYPEKYFFLFTLACAALAARGLSIVAARPRPAMWAGLAGVALLGVGALGARLAGASLMQALVGRLGTVSPAEAGQVVAHRALLALALGAAAWLALVLVRRSGPGEARIKLCLGTLLTIDLLIASLHLLSWAPSSLYRDRPLLVDHLAAAERLAGDAGPSRLYRANNLDLGGDDAQLVRATLTPDCGMELGIDHLDAYDNFKTAAETELWGALRSRPLKLLQVTATRYALLGDGQLGAIHPGLTVRQHYQQLHASLVEVAGASARAYLAADARPIANTGAAARAMAEDAFVAGTNALVEGGEARAASGRCELERYAPETVLLRCQASAPAYAIVADSAFPGWEATVDGQPAPILIANAVMRAVPVPAGASRVALRYRPRSVRTGAIASLLGLCIAAVLIRRGRV